MPPERDLSAACALVRSGELTEGIDALVALREEAVDLPDLDRATLLSTLLECRLARGNLAEAMVVGEELGDLLDGEGLPAALAHLARGELAAALGHADAAVEHFTRAGQLAPDASVDVLPWRGVAALAHLRAGNRKVAAELAQANVADAETAGSPYALASALRILAVVETGHDRTQHLLRARAVLADTTAERLSAQINTDLAGLLLLTHTPEARRRALDLLRSAEEHAGRQELWPLQGRVRRLLDRIGEQPHRVQTEAVAALTISERRVARLAAEGLTNRQIANELVVTIKAVEWHLSHVYRKLGIDSRTHLAATLGASV